MYYNEPMNLYSSTILKLEYHFPTVVVKRLCYSTTHNLIMVHSTLLNSMIEPSISTRTMTLLSVFLMHIICLNSCHKVCVPNQRAYYLKIDRIHNENVHGLFAYNRAIPKTTKES